MSRVRSFALFSAVVALSGCYSYRVAPLASVEPRQEVRVTARDGRRVDLFGVTVDGDTLRGTGLRQAFLWQRRAKVAIAVADLTTVQVRRFDARRSVVAGVAVAAVVGVTVGIVRQMDWGVGMGWGSPGDGW